MNLLKYVSVGIAVIGALSGCGRTTVETVMAPTGAYPNARGKGMTAVILPFADYSDGDNIASAFRRNMFITESLTDNLTRNGFGIAVQEDVFQYLVQQDVISIASYSDHKYRMSSPSLIKELEDPDWSETMKDRLRGYYAYCSRFERT